MEANSANVESSMSQDHGSVVVVVDQVQDESNVPSRPEEKSSIEMDREIKDGLNLPEEDNNIQSNESLDNHISEQCISLETIDGKDVEVNVMSEKTVPFNDQDNQEQAPNDIAPQSRIEPSSSSPTNKSKFKKNFYIEPPPPVKSIKQHIAHFREKHHIVINGKGKIPNPMLFLSSINMPTYFVDTLKLVSAKINKDSLTPIIAQCLPIILSGRNLVVIGRVDLDRRVTYIMPALPHIKDQPPLQPKEGPIAVFVGSCELSAAYIYEAVQKCLEGNGLNCSRAENIQQEVEIVVDTIDTLVKVIKAKLINLKRCSYFVIDKCDQLLNSGQISLIHTALDSVRTGCQVQLWLDKPSAKLHDISERIESILEVRYNVINIKTNIGVKQEFLVAEDDQEKYAMLETILMNYTQGRRKIIIITKSYDKVIQIESNIKKMCQKRLSVVVMHENINILARRKASKKYKVESVNVLVSTYKYSKLFLRSQVLIFFDFPSSLKECSNLIEQAKPTQNIHSILTYNNSEIAGQLVTYLEQNGDSVPEKLIALAEKSSKPKSRVPKITTTDLNELIVQYKFDNIQLKIKQNIIVPKYGLKEACILILCQKLVTKSIVILFLKEEVLTKLAKRTILKSALIITEKTLEPERSNFLNRFISAQNNVLLTTHDTAAELKLSGADVVVNYDFPLEFDGYIKSLSYATTASYTSFSTSFSTSSNLVHAFKLMAFLKHSNQEIPSLLIKKAMLYENKQERITTNKRMLPNELANDDDDETGGPLEKRTRTDATEFVDELTLSNRKITELELEPKPEGIVSESSVPINLCKYNYYEEHLRTKERSMDEILTFRKENIITIKGLAPNPIFSYTESSLPDYCLQPILDLQSDYSTTALPAQCLPIILSGHNLMAIVNTEQDKIISYVLPAIVHIKKQPPLQSDAGPICIVVAAKHKIADDITNYFDTFTRGSDAGRVLLPPALCCAKRKWDFQKGRQLAVVTPDCLIEMVSEGVLNLKRCSYLVIDNCFNYSIIREILKNIEADCQIQIWCDTWTAEAEMLANDYIKSRIRVMFGRHEMRDTTPTVVADSSPVVRNEIVVCHLNNRLNVLKKFLLKHSENTKNFIIYVPVRRDIPNVFEMVKNLHHKNLKAVDFYNFIVSTSNLAEREKVANSAFKIAGNVLITASEDPWAGCITSCDIVINYDTPSKILTFERRLEQAKECIYSILQPYAKKKATILIDYFEGNNLYVDPKLKAIVELNPHIDVKKEVIATKPTTIESEYVDIQIETTQEVIIIPPVDKTEKLTELVLQISKDPGNRLVILRNNILSSTQRRGFQLPDKIKAAFITTSCNIKLRKIELAKFKKGIVRILVTTFKEMGKLNLKNITTVIMYEFPQNFQCYINAVSLASQLSIAFFFGGDSRHSDALVGFLKTMKQNVAKFLTELDVMNKNLANNSLYKKSYKNVNNLELDEEYFESFLKEECHNGRVRESSYSSNRHVERIVDRRRTSPGTTREYHNRERYCDDSRNERSTSSRNSSYYEIDNRESGRSYGRRPFGSPTPPPPPFFETDNVRDHGDYHGRKISPRNDDYNNRNYHDRRSPPGFRGNHNHEEFVRSNWPERNRSPNRYRGGEQYRISIKNDLIDYRGHDDELSRGYSRRSISPASAHRNSRFEDIDLNRFADRDRSRSRQYHQQGSGYNPNPDYDHDRYRRAEFSSPGTSRWHPDLESRSDRDLAVGSSSVSRSRDIQDLYGDSRDFDGRHLQRVQYDRMAR